MQFYDLVLSCLFQSPHRRGGSRDEIKTICEWLDMQRGFNPLIGGADRATGHTIDDLSAFDALFQSPHRRGGSRDSDITTVCPMTFSGFNPLIGGADRATR